MCGLTDGTLPCANAVKTCQLADSLDSREAALNARRLFVKRCACGGCGRTFVDTEELELGIDVLLLDPGVRGDIDARHGDRSARLGAGQEELLRLFGVGMSMATARGMPRYYYKTRMGYLKV